MNLPETVSTLEACRVLVVDDEEFQRKLIKQVIAAFGLGFQVLEASNGVEAIEILKSHSVDAVLLDKRMPVMNGDETCRHIRGTLGQPLLPVLMMTGNAASEELPNSFLAGASDFISKPYEPSELIARLKRAVETKRMTDQLDRAENLLFALARMVEAKDATTGDHCSRLRHMGVIFGQTLGLSSREIDALRRGGIVHDIGKLGIPDSILLKEGPLTEEEWILMRSHTVIGGHICEGLYSMRDVMPIILHHHERWDGSGYPFGLAGEEIPYLARVFQILDIYDALSSERPYKPVMSKQEIIAIFEAEMARGWRDPELVRVFVELLQEGEALLSLPEDVNATQDEVIFNSIASTGVIEWDKVQNKVAKV